MFAYPTASTLGLGLDLGLTPSSTVSLPILSANGHFAVESYTPSEGCAGILITVSLTSMLPVNDREPTDELRLIINDKRLCSRVEYDSNGNATLRALLSTSLASLCGLVPMSLHLHRDGELFDYCNFGHFNFVPVPMTTPSPSPSASASTSSKRNRDDESRTPSPVSKRSKFLAVDPAPPCDSHQARLIIETDIAELGDLSTWSPAEMRDRRRFVRLLRRQQGSGIHLRMIAISTEEVAHDDRNVINCMLPPDCGDEPSISSVDIIKALELLVNPPDRRLSVEERNRVRRNIDTLRPATLKKGDESLNWIMQLRSPRPITIAKDVKIFKWSSLEAALVKIMKKYSYQNDDSPVGQRGSPTLDEAPSALWLTPTRRQFDGATTKPDQIEPQTPSFAAYSPASLETTSVVSTVQGSLSTRYHTPMSPAFSANECLNVQQPDALLGFNADVFLQNLLEPPAYLSSTSSASASSDSTFSSDSVLGLELMTPPDRILDEYFDVENGCSVSSDEYLGPVDLEALFAVPVLGMDAGLEGQDRVAVAASSTELLAAADLENFLGEIFDANSASSCYGINQWDFGCGPTKPSELDVSNDINSHLFPTPL